MEPKAGLIPKPTGMLTYRAPGSPMLTYREDGCQPIPRLSEEERLNDDEYGRVLRGKVLANTDIIALNSQRRVFYLAWRRAIPMTGFFWMGGNTGDINVALADGAAQVFERETELRIDQSRLAFVAPFEYFWKDRSQEPKSIGCHMLGLTYSVDLTDEEVAQIHLDPNEYQGGSIRTFDRAALVEENVFPNIIDAYDLIFPPEKLHHVVLISFKDGTPGSVMQDIYDRYQTLADDCGGKEAGILSFEVKKNLDSRKNVHLVEIAMFTGNDALQAFRVHPKHKEITDILRDVADWQVGDIMG